MALHLSAHQSINQSIFIYPVNQYTIDIGQVITKLI
jgi:hypothetical protein